MPKSTLSKVIRRSARSLAAGFSIGLLLVLSTSPVLAGAGHDHGESAFQKNTGQPQPFKVAPEMMERLGIKLETVSRRTLAVGLKLTGQVESQPNQKVNVTLPTGGTIKQLLVKTGDRVSAGQAVAVITSPELNSLRTESLDRQTDAMAAMEQAKTDVRLAQQNYDKQQIIAQAEINQAQKAYDFAASRAEGDRTLVSQGALARRTGLESDSLMAQAQANLDRAKTKST
jgi:membrane fusion protein, heavy metal efflux system